MRFTKDNITAAQAGTLHGLFLERVRRTPGAPGVSEFHRPTQSWKHYTWREVALRAARWQEALAREGLQPGERVAISLRNSLDWIAFDQAALGLGLVVVPLYVDDRPDSVGFILDDCGAALLLVQDGLRWRRLAPACGHLQTLRRVVVHEGAKEDTFGDPRVRAADAWLPEGNFDLREGPNDPEALATIVYTSGTTGRSKGVMLNHRNILSVMEGGLLAVKIYREDSFLSFLPLSHMFERCVGYYLPVAAGSSIAYARSVANLSEDLAQARPTLMLAVPRVFERIHGRMQDQLARAPAWRRFLFQASVHVGWQRFEWQQRRARWSPLLLLWPLLHALVGKKVKARLGGNLRFVVSGGAALPPVVAKEFIGLGLPVLQGYGLTESSPQVCVNRLEFNDPTSVGAPLEGVEVMIGHDQELLVRSPGNMMGYWNNAQATAAAVHEGWLHTGDQAAIRGGRIYITGRIKDVLVLSNGEKVPPAEMEQAITMDPLFEQVMIVGEGRSFLAALAVLNPERWANLVRGMGLSPADPASLTDRHVHHELLVRVGQQLHGFPTWAKVRRLHLSLEPWTVENDLLTPTMKVKRAAVLAHHRAQVEHIYEHTHAE
jgi:long-chain acyl-CoA synthetase